MPMNNERFTLHPRTYAAACALLGFALGFAGCSHLKMPSMPWASSSKPQVAATKPPPPIAPSPAATPSAATQTYGDTMESVVASVDGNPITSRDLKDPGAVQAAGLAGVPTGAVSPEDSRLVLKALIEQKLLEEESQKYADKVGEDEVDRYL